MKKSFKKIKISTKILIISVIGTFISIAIAISALKTHEQEFIDYLNNPNVETISIGLANFAIFMFIGISLMVVTVLTFLWKMLVIIKTDYIDPTYMDIKSIKSEVRKAQKDYESKRTKEVPSTRKRSKKNPTRKDELKAGFNNSIEVKNAGKGIVAGN